MTCTFSEVDSATRTAVAQKDRIVHLHIRRQPVENIKRQRIGCEAFIRGDRSDNLIPGQGYLLLRSDEPRLSEDYGWDDKASSAIAENLSGPPPQPFVVFQIP